jgi:BirA family transcriptional regulator, biotin operon repressor / biotin---[acetyl-CoA-carboxylase] ligase
MLNSKNINYLHFDTLDSTNTWTKNNAHALDPHQITCVTAAMQTAGIGRFKKPWVSPKGENIYATLYFTLPKASSVLPHLALLLSFSCAKMLRAKGFHPEIKAPNDLLIEKKKVAGILCEVIDLNGVWGVILGIGLNVNMSQEHLDAIDQPATSLLQISGRAWDFDELLPPLIEQFFEDLAHVEKVGWEAFTKESSD